ncbi:MAG: T9SS type A sorting domain-containing protein [Candidatus Kapaibacterium sp.]
MAEAISRLIIYILFAVAAISGAIAQSKPTIPLNSYARNLLERAMYLPPTPPGIVFADNSGKGNSKVNADAVNSDTTTAGNHISQVRHQNDIYYVKVELASYDVTIELSVYNLLGKKVKDIHRGAAMPEGAEYRFDSYNLPNGVYICILNGPNFRDTEKFIVSR